MDPDANAPMEFRQGDLVWIGVGYDVNTHEVFWTVKKKGSEPFGALRLDEAYITDTIADLSAALVSLRTGKPPAGWEKD